MVNPPKKKGTMGESAFVTYLRSRGYPASERRTLSGTTDKGDIQWLPWIAVEVKNSRTPRSQAWLREVEVEREHAGADVGVVVHKPHGVGLGDTGNWHVVMTADTFMDLVERIERCRR